MVTARIFVREVTHKSPGPRQVMEDAMVCIRRSSDNDNDGQGSAVEGESADGRGSRSDHAGYDISILNSAEKYMIGEVMWIVHIDVIL
jgi:hypothetical protein